MQRWIGALLVAAMVLTACTGDGESDATTTAPGVGGAGGEATTSTTLALPPETTSVPGTATTIARFTTTLAGVASAECLVGEWELNSARFVETIARAFASEFPDATVEYRGGSYVTTLGADGSMSAVRDGWMMTVGTQQGTLVQTIDARESGTYEVDEAAGTVSINIDPGGISTVTTQLEVDGVLQASPFPAPPPIELPIEAPNPSGTFSCSEDQLVVTTAEGVVSEFTRR